MSRYVIDGILNDVAEGKDVTIVSPMFRYSEDLLEQVIRAAGLDQWSKVVRANGNRSATHAGGGTVRPIAATASLRGRRTDVLLVLEVRAMSEAQQQEIRAASEGVGEVQLLS